MFSVRMPPVIVLALTGMCLALSGAILQSLTKNDLADPGIIGINAGVEINSLSDLPKLKQMMEHMKMKINKSKLAAELGVDRRTVDKYLKGFVTKRTRKKSSKIDEYYEVIATLLSEDSKQVFYYRRVLWQYLKDNHGLECGASTFRAYIFMYS